MRWQIAVCFVICLAPLSCLSQSNDAATIKERWVGWLLETANVSSTQYWAELYTNSLLSNGSWADVDYEDQNTEVWTTLEHLTRIYLMSSAFNLQSTALYHNSTVLSKIQLAITYWLVTRPLNPNWYQNQFVVPTFFGQIGLLMSGYLPNATNSKILTGQMAKTGPCTVWDAANQVMCANVHVMIGLIYNNSKELQYGIQTMYAILVIAPGPIEGIKQDGSFFFHGNQLYSGKYGNNVTQDIVLMIYLTKNTSFAITDTQLTVFAMHVLDGQQWMIAGPSWDYGVVGRAVARPWTIECTFPPPLIEDVGGPRASEWAMFAARLVNNSAYPLLGHRHYWKADYTVHRAGNYFAYVKMFSNRTYNAECVNYEGKESLHISDGSLQLYKSGQEFEFIFPTWDWQRLPGTTIPIGAQPLDCSEVKSLGITNFVGGVSDTFYGCSAMEFQSVFGGKLYLKKAWFFFPGIIVNLGTDIQFPLDYPVVTTMNQCLLNGNVYTSSSEYPLANGNATQDDIWWVHHDDVGYVFEEGVSVTIENQNRTGEWPTIGDFSGNITKEVFGLFINHPASPLVNASYQYTVIPDIAIEEMANVKQLLSGIQVIENSPSLQAVFSNNTEQGLFEVVFYQPGTATAGQGWTVTVDQPCTLMIVDKGTTLTITLSDPTQSQALVVVTIDRELEGECCGSINSTTSVAKFPLPTGEFAGSSVICTCNVM